MRLTDLLLIATGLVLSCLTDKQNTGTTGPHVDFELQLLGACWFFADVLNLMSANHIV